MSKVLIDTSFIIAVFREIEEKHELALNTCEKVLNDCECYISNGILTEVTTIIMMRTKDINLTKQVYYFMRDNFIIINEYNISEYNEKVFRLFEKYNNSKFNVSFIDCSVIILSKHYGIDEVISFDKGFKLFDGIKLYDFS